MTDISTFSNSEEICHFFIKCYFYSKKFRRQAKKYAIIKMKKF